MPLSFDLPLDDLKTYRGRSPKPSGFDSFWADGLEEMRSIDPQVELVPSGFDTAFAECSYLYFTGVGGARIEAKLARPKAGKDGHPAVLQFHGYAGRIGDWSYGPMLAMCAEGYTYAGMNCRGQGGRSQDLGGVTGTTLRGHIVRGLSEAIDGAPEKLLYRNIFLDTAQFAGIVMAMQGVDPARVGAWGESQGGGLTLACAALEPRIARIAPVYPFLTDYRRVWEMDQAKDAYMELQDWFRRHDPRHERETEMFEALGHIDVQHLADRIRAKVFWRIGLMDTICPPSTQFAAYNRLVSEKSLDIYPDYGHELLPDSLDRLFEFMREL